jgi:carboxypeptidase C (cathepsin A)
LRIYQSGHMVPMDQPEAALAMLDEFFGKWSAEAN